VILFQFDLTLNVVFNMSLEQRWTWSRLLYPILS